MALKEGWWSHWNLQFILKRGRSGTFRCTRDTEHKKSPRVCRRGFFYSSCEHLSLFQHDFNLISFWSNRDEQNVFSSREGFLIRKFKNVFNTFCSLLMYLCMFVGDSSVQCVLILKLCIAVSCDWWWLFFCLSVVAAAFSFTWKLVAAVQEENHSSFFWSVFANLLKYCSTLINAQSLWHHSKTVMWEKKQWNLVRLMIKWTKCPLLMRNYEPNSDHLSSVCSYADWLFGKRFPP